MVDLQLHPVDRKRSSRRRSPNGIGTSSRRTWSSRVGIGRCLWLGERSRSVRFRTAPTVRQQPSTPQSSRSSSFYSKQNSIVTMDDDDMQKLIEPSRVAPNIGRPTVSDPPRRRTLRAHGTAVALHETFEAIMFDWDGRSEERRV